MYWAASNDLEHVRLLVEEGHDINEPHPVSGTTPLHRAAHNNRTAMCEYLMDHGANIQAKDVQGMTPLHLAAQFGRVETIELLLDRGADLNALSDKGADAAHMAMAFNPFPEVHSYLVRCKLAQMAGPARRSRGRVM